MAYKDKDKQKLVAKEHYDANKTVYKSRAKKHTIAARKRNKLFIEEYLKEHPCVDCGEKDIIVLEFDHVRGLKKINIADTINRAWSLENLKAEISKCEVRCANCHRRMTHKRRIEKV